MGTRTIRRTWKVNGVYTDPTSVKLSDPTGAYGVKRDDTNAVVVADGTSMTKVSTGIYSYIFDEPAAGLAYTAYVEIVWGGQTFRYEHNFPAAASSSAGGLIVTYDDLAAEVGHWLGWKRSGWTGDQEATIEACVRSGVRQFYWPPPIGGEPKAHQWSFLRPVEELTMIIGTGDYTLPDDFGCLVGKLYYSEDDTSWFPIEDWGAGRVLNYRSRNPADGKPCGAAIVPVTCDGTVLQGSEIMFAPAPDDTYTVRYQYQILPDAVDSTHAYHLGSAMHSETILASCLAIAELRNRDGETSQQAYWLQRLAASVLHDRRNAPRNLGYMGDRSGGVPTPKRSNLVTYNGTLYD